MVSSDPTAVRKRPVSALIGLAIAAGPSVLAVVFGFPANAQIDFEETTKAAGFTYAGDTWGSAWADYIQTYLWSLYAYEQLGIRCFWARPSPGSWAPGA